MIPHTPPPLLGGKRIDLHCHSDASNKAAEVVLNAMNCPECYSAPSEVYAQALRRGMDFVTITDHDSIDGVTRITDRGNVLVGEELTCWFPEDRCKLHVLIWGITRAQHEDLQKRADSVYQVAEYIENHRIAHAVAHPIYRQNDKLERWHLERLLLLFKGFEALNGAHSGLHRDAFEPVLENLTRGEIQRLSDVHKLQPRWPEPWIKSRTAGSDDHGLLNIGRTYTIFPDEVQTVDDLLNCLRDGRCRPSGEIGSSAKLAHAFYGIAIRYYTRHILSGRSPNLVTTILQTIVGERPAPTKLHWNKQGSNHKLNKHGRRVAAPFRRTHEPKFGTERLKRLFLTSAKNRMSEHPALRDVLKTGLPPLGEHDEMFRFVSSINRDVTRGIADAINNSIDDASFTGLFDSIGAVIAQQFVLMPYYFAVFHQNKERHLLREITRQHTKKTPQNLRVGLFTDTLDDVNGVGRFLRDMAAQAQRKGYHFTVHTSTDRTKFDVPNRKNFIPLLSRPLPYYEDLKLHLPPVLEILEWADRQQFDAIHISTPGPMGLCGWLASKMLRVPLVGTYHTDFPAYIDSLTGDHRIVNGAVEYFKVLYGQMDAVFTRSRTYRFNLRDIGVADDRMLTIQPGINTEKFHPRHRDETLFARLGVKEPRRVLYAGRVSVEKNLPLLVESFKMLAAARRDVALVVAGDGPYVAEMKTALKGLPAYFLGFQSDEQLAPLYASSDLFAFPSRTDTLGQVVMEAQASGLPVLVSDEGGPKEMVQDGATGVIVPGRDVQRWCNAMDNLLSDDDLRQRLARTAPQRMARFSLDRTFESFWAEHVTIVEPPSRAQELAPAVASPGTVSPRGAEATRGI
jgi:glycosyltransferase involved in cell wall biosynthesis